MLFKYLFIFSIFSIFGWILETLFRSYRAKRFINPGFMNGIVVPLYGVGVVILNLLCILLNKINCSYKLVLIFILSTVILTILELITAIIFKRLFSVKLWDYSNNKFNYKGYICLAFSICWGVLALIYYMFLYEYINELAINLSNNNICIFIDGIFYGVFIVDLCMSIGLTKRIKEYAVNLKETINIEKFKIDLRINNKGLKNILFPYFYINKFLKDKIKR